MRFLACYLEKMLDTALPVYYSVCRKRYHFVWMEIVASTPDCGHVLSPRNPASTAAGKWNYMEIIITKGAVLFAIILLGYILRRTSFLPKETFRILSKLVLNVTLPCTFVSNLAGMTMRADLLWMFALGFLGNAVYLLIGTVLSKKDHPNGLILNLLNFSGYNIGCFALPFVAGMLGQETVVSLCMFDFGNALWANEGTNALCMYLQGGQAKKPVAMVRHLLTRPTVLVLLTMPILSLLHVTLPSPILQFVQTVGSANSFLSMFLIGFGLSVSFQPSHLRWIGTAFLVRFGIAAVLAVLCRKVLPLSDPVWLGAMLAVFAPASAMGVVHTEERGADVGLAGSWNALSILCSMLFMGGILSLAGAIQ